jgi:transcription antitermination factor NusG
MAEFVAHDALRRRGFRVCLPVYRKLLRGKRDNYGAMVMRPLFRGYLFVELHLGQAWIDILYTPGVCNLVRQAGDDLPAFVEDGLVEEIRDEARAGLFDDRPLSRGVSQATFRAGKAMVKPGDAMRVAEGPFASFMATLQDIDDRGRAQTLLTMFNRQVPAELGLETLAGVFA